MVVSQTEAGHLQKEFSVNRAYHYTCDSRVVLQGDSQVFHSKDIENGGQGATPVTSHYEQRTLDIRNRLCVSFLADGEE